MNAEPFRLAAALAYYTLSRWRFFSSPRSASRVSHSARYRARTVSRTSADGSGPKSSDAVQNTVAAASTKSSSGLATLLGSPLLVGESAVFLGDTRRKELAPLQLGSL